MLSDAERERVRVFCDAVLEEVRNEEAELQADFDRLVAELRGQRDGLRCVECRRQWTDESERWRTYLTIDDETALYCLECAEREFGDG